MEKGKKYYWIMIGIGFIALLGISYALFSIVLVGEKKYTVESRGLRVYLDETMTANDIILENAIPVTDDKGIENTSYQFSLVNEEKEDLAYTIYLKEEEYSNKTPASAIRYHYTRDIEKVDVIRNLTDQMTEDGKYYLETGVIPGENTYHYTFQMWIGYTAGNEILNTKCTLHLEIDAAQTIDLYHEEILNGTDPVLSDNLIPVTIENDGTVKKASLFQEWYNYSKQEWANAIVLEDKTQKYKAGETIEVEFENKNTVVSNGTTVDAWLSHPAFQAFDTNGFWVGKFESGYRGATSTAAAQQNNSDYSKLIIKPNVYSWRNITVGNAFKASYDYMRNEESHMMKNTEWGAVALLQHSKYGSRSSVRINNNASFLTGYAAVSEPTCGPTTNNASNDCNKMGTGEVLTQPYNTSTGYTASTTSNITGVYDMSGGTWEYVMGYNRQASSVGGSSGLTSIYGDFFSSTEWEKYYDSYSNTTETVYTGRILGDATGEMGPFFKVTAPNGTAYHNSGWYNDYGYFPTVAGPWFRRGGAWNDGSTSGIFTFYYNAGGNTGISFRVVLALQ